MMLMMLAKGASIISIIRGSFLQQGVTNCISLKFGGVEVLERGEGGASARARAPPSHPGLRQTCACALQRCIMCRQGDGFWLAPGGVKLKKTTFGPNPWFWAQNHGFGSDPKTT